MNDQSKSRLFTVKEGTLISAVEPSSANAQQYFQPGSVIDKKYEILGLLGEGGMGAVYKVRHLMLNKNVALKTFRSANLTTETCIRFQREAQSIAKLNHENIIQIFDYGLSEVGLPYYTMEYLEGRSLADRIEVDGPLAVPDTIRLFEQICNGLAAAHRKGIIHRDLKPANIFLVRSKATSSEAESVKIVDFGIASLTSSSIEGQRLTAIGDVFGSPLYMSPEQSAGQAVTESADIYSLGCALFEALIGRPPYRGASAMDTIMMHHSEKQPTLKEAAGRSFPGAMERVVLRMLEKSPEARQQNMEQVAAELFQCSQRQGLDAHRAMWSVRDLDNASYDEEQDQTALSESKSLVLRMIVVAVVLIGTACSLVGYYYFSSKEQRAPATTLGVFAKSAPDDALFAEMQKANSVPKKLSSLTNDPAGGAAETELIAEGRYTEAESQLALMPDSREVAQSLNELAHCYAMQRQSRKAEPLCKRAVSICEKDPRPNDKQLADNLLVLGICYREQKRFTEAVPVCKRALDIAEKRSDTVLVADSLSNLGCCYDEQGQQDKAGQLYKRALVIYDKKLAPDDPRMPVVRALKDGLQRRAALASPRHHAR